MNNKEFIINGKLYSTEGSLLLCKSTDACFGEIEVYHTKKGAFFSVSTPFAEKTEVKVHYSGERVVITVIKLVSLGSHSGMPYDNIAVLVQPEMNLMSGIGALVNRKFAVVVECVSGSVGSTLLAFLGKYTKQLTATVTPLAIFPIAFFTASAAL